MRWIATLVAMCLVALGAMRSPRAHATDREPTLDDASTLVAKLAPRRLTIAAPHKRCESCERPVAVEPSPSFCVVGPTQLALDSPHTAPPPPWVPHVHSRAARGPPRASSLDVVSQS